MSIQLNDKSSVSFRLVNGQTRLTFHALNKVVVLPVGVTVNIQLITKLYNGLK